MTTLVLGCPTCEWSFVPTAGVEVDHFCGEGTVMSCDRCGWTKELTGAERPGFAEALAELHMTRPGHE